MGGCSSCCDDDSHSGTPEEKQKLRQPTGDDPPEDEQFEYDDDDGCCGCFGHHSDTTPSIKPKKKITEEVSAKPTSKKKERTGLTNPRLSSAHSGKTLEIPTTPAYGLAGRAGVARTTGSEAYCLIALSTLLSGTKPTSVTNKIVYSWMDTGSEVTQDKLGNRSVSVRDALHAIVEPHTLAIFDNAEITCKLTPSLAEQPQQLEAFWKQLFLLHRDHDRCSVGAILRCSSGIGSTRAIAVALVLYETDKSPQPTLVCFDPSGYGDVEQTEEVKKRPLVFFSSVRFTIVTGETTLETSFWEAVAKILARATQGGFFSTSSSFTWTATFLHSNAGRMRRASSSAGSGGSRDTPPPGNGSGSQGRKKKGSQKGRNKRGSQFAASAANVGDGQPDGPIN